MEKQKAEPRYPYHRHEQKEIDALVYQLYGLDENDIREVTLWYCRRYATLAAAQGVTAQAHADYGPYLDRAADILNQPAAHWRQHPLLVRIAQDENEQTEFKEFLAVDARGAKPADAGKHIASAVASFLNADLDAEPGLLLVGVNNVGRVVGIDRDLAVVNRKNHDGFELTFREILERYLSPIPSSGVTASFVSLPGGTVFVVEVWPTPGITYCGGVVYRRHGGKKLELKGRELVEWSAKRQGG